MDEPALEGDGDALGRARAFVVNSLAARAQSVAEVEAKLVVRGFAPELVESVVAEAERLGYLDDVKLAEQLARGFQARRYGRRRAALALTRRGLGAVGDAALDTVYGDSDEAALAAAALGRRRVADERDRRRAVAFLVRRGFSTSVAWSVVRDRERSAGDG